MNKKVTLIMTERVRPKLQRPLGKLFPGLPQTIERIGKLRPSRLISIGDRVTSDLLSAGIRPDVAVVDLVVMRSSAGKEIRRAIAAYKVPSVRVKNPAGRITPELWSALENAGPPLKIIVDGEEDLAAIPAVLTAPLGSVVVYGQPKEGVVLVEVTEKKRDEFKALLNEFKTATE